MSGKQFDQQQKAAIVQNAKEIGFKEASRIAGVHYTTVYDWSREIEAIGKEAFLVRETKRDGRGIKEISEKQEQLVLDTRRSNPGYGPGQIRNQLRRQAETVSIRTVRRIMEANGYKFSSRKSAQKATRFEASRPLELGQMDILQFFIHKLQVYLILLIDDFSRFILSWSLLQETSIDAVIDVVQRGMVRYGKLEELLTDRGFVFYSWRSANRFERYLELERIEHTHARPHHPQTLGKVEAINRRVKSELITRKEFQTVQEASTAIEQWVDHYNYHRTHQGLGGFLTPADRFHGKSDQVLRDVASGVDITKTSIGIERSIVNLVVDSRGMLTFYLLGQAVAITGGEHVGGNDCRRSGDHDSSPSIIQGEGACPECGHIRDLSGSGDIAENRLSMG